MNTLETLLGVSIVFWGFIFLYLLWLHSRIKKISKTVDRLRQTEST